MKIKVKIIMFGLLISIKLSAQDPIFSQYFMSPLQLNPAFAGVNYSPAIYTNYRLQWPSVSTTYSTFNLGFDQFFDQSHLGIGVNILNDAAGEGALKTTKASGMLAYRLNINDETFIRGGIELGYVQRRLNWEKFIFWDALRANNGVYTPGGSSIPSTEVAPSNTLRSFLDVGSGLLLYNKKYYIGISLDHINTPIDDFKQNIEQNYIGLPIRTTLMAGYQYDLSSKRKLGVDYGSYISPTLLYARQAKFSELHFGVGAALSQIFGGVYYRLSGTNGDAFIAQIGIRNNRFKIGYSFDVTTSGLGLGNTGGSHEIGINYVFGPEEKKSKYSDCFLIFR